MSTYEVFLEDDDPLHPLLFSGSDPQVPGCHLRRYRVDRAPLQEDAFVRDTRNDFVFRL